MNARLAALGARRAALVAQSDAARGALAEDARALRGRFAAADRLVAVARSGPARALLLGAAALVVVGRPRRVLGLALRGLALWPLVSSLLPKLGEWFRAPKASA